MKIVLNFSVLRFLLLVCAMFSILSCTADAQESCEQLEEKYVDADGMVDLLDQTSFSFSEQFDTSQSSWIKAASYYSCDGAKGYFVLRTYKKVYLYKDVPKDLWNRFKQADSLGSFYNIQIKGRYEY